VLALKPSKGTWAPDEEADRPVEAAQQLAWADARRGRVLGPRSPGPSAMAAPRPGGRPTRRSPPPAGAGSAPPAGRGHHRPCHLAGAHDLVAADQPAPAGCRRPGASQPGRGGAAVRAAHVVEQGDKQVKQQLGWADFQVRSDRAICRHFVLVCCALSCCWHATHGVADPCQPTSRPRGSGCPHSGCPTCRPILWHPKRPRPRGRPRGGPSAPSQRGGPRRDVAGRPGPRPRLADPVAVAATLLACVVDQPPPARAGHA
jgi:hypothetical protein